MKNVEDKKTIIWIILCFIMLSVVVAVWMLHLSKAPERVDGYIHRQRHSTITINGINYTAPYVPISQLPYGYNKAGDLTYDQISDPDMEGLPYFINENEDDILVYQQTNKRISLDTLSGEELEWNYSRWIPIKNDAEPKQTLSLDDIRFLVKDDEKITSQNFKNFKVEDMGSDKNEKMYKIDAVFNVYCEYSKDASNVQHCVLKANEEPNVFSGQKAIDLFNTDYENLEMFIKNNKQRVGGYN